MPRTAASSAVLFSGGLDSTVLLADEARRLSAVWPIFIRCGLAWEEGEAAAIERLLDAPPFAGRVNAPHTLDADMRDVYPADHWAVTGHPPAFDTPDEDVYLDGRNVVLISKASVLCARLGVGRLALGPLAGNPFPDTTPEFITAMAAALSLGLARPFELVTPLADRAKSDVIRLGIELGVPLDVTLSCMKPSAGRHCGRCSKCRERRDAFRASRVADHTEYANPPAR